MNQVTFPSLAESAQAIAKAHIDDAFDDLMDYVFVEECIQYDDFVKNLISIRETDDCLFLDLLICRCSGDEDQLQNELQKYHYSVMMSEFLFRSLNIKNEIHSPIANEMAIFEKIQTTVEEYHNDPEFVAKNKELIDETLEFKKQRENMINRNSENLFQLAKEVLDFEPQNPPTEN